MSNAQSQAPPREPSGNVLHPIITAAFALTLATMLGEPDFARACDTDGRRATDDSGAETETTEAESRPPRGFLDFNTYYDSRSSTVLTLNILANLPHRFQYFSLTNYFSPVNATVLSDLESFYTEQNIRFSPKEALPVDATLQWVVRSPGENDALRVGARWRLSDTSGIESFFERLNMAYSVNFHFYQLDFVSQPGWRWQIEHVYRMNVLPQMLGKRVYVGGFLDHNLQPFAPADPYASRIVTEHQLGIRVTAGLHVVAEYRFNEYFDKSEHGLGIGLQFVIPFTYIDR